MRLFHSEMLHTIEATPTDRYRGPAYGARYDRRARRTGVPAPRPEPEPARPIALADAPRDILFRLAELDCAA